MPISIKNQETEELARKLADLTHESITSAVHKSLEERYARLSKRRPGVSLGDQLRAIAARAASREVISTMSEDEVLGYDEFGAPTR
jgi:antitoxin VapB